MWPPPPFDLGFTPDRPRLVGVSLRPMPSPIRSVALLALSLTLQSNGFAQHGAWVDIVPMTRNLFGADDAQDLSFAVGWSSSTTGNGWRSLIGFDLGQESQDSFGTTITGACEVECPKGISLDNIARMNRDYLKSQVTGE